MQPWGLSPAQAEAARSGLTWLETQTVSSVKGRNTKGTSVNESRRSGEPSQFLIWAVTGAGKTEMIFPFIGYTLARGGKVLIATPRRDVVLELRPRVMRAFKGHAVVTLYGGSEERWDSGPIVIATTHQLLRYREAFDLVIIDELDAFPYHGDPMLEFAAHRACKPCGSTLLLSATPPAKLRRDTVRGKLPHVKVPARYHGYALPVPRQLAVPSLPQMRKADAVPSALLTALRASLARGAQLFVFVPNIATVEPLVHLLRRTLLAAQPSAGGGTPPAPAPASLVIDGTSSKDAGRTDKVQQFRDGHIRILVTTTILERGVTVPKTDVFILDANSRLFDEASLVQMSGRAGRSKDDPAGRVYFAASERTKAQSGAIAQIKSMNRLAKRKGFLHGRPLEEN
nr:helicase-related protein [Paenibacillus albiflavus]